MATGDYLPPVVTRLTGDIGDFASMIAEAKALLKSLGGEANVALNIKTDGLKQAAAQVAALKAALKDLNGTVKISADGLGNTAAQAAAAAAATKQTTLSDLDAARAEYMLAAAERMRANTAKDAAAAQRDLNGATARAGGGALFGGAFWGITANALHWIIAGGAEILAVTVPAIIALGAGLLVMAPAAQDAAAHMQALNTATSASNQMYGQTIGDVLGLGHALQTASDAAQPAVYGILGSALEAVKGHMSGLVSTGDQVAQMLQTFAAKVAVDFGPGGSMGSTVNSLLAHMVTDLAQIGALFGNLGHALLSFASQMPGLAEILLGTFSHLAAWLSDAVQFAAKLQVAGVSILTLAMGFEEFQRWGGLIVTMLNKIGLAAVAVSGKWYTLEHLGSIFQGLMSILPNVVTMLGNAAIGFGNLISKAPLIGGLGNVVKGAGEDMVTLGEAATGAIAAMSPLGALLTGAIFAGFGFLIEQGLTAKNVLNQTAGAMQHFTQSASNSGAMQAALSSIALLNSDLKTETGSVNDMASSWGRSYGIVTNAARGQALNSTRVQQLNSDLQQQVQDVNNVSQGAAYLARTYGTTLVGGIALATEANVKLVNGITGSGQAAQVARMQIASLVQGYLAMGQPLTAVGADTTALAIQSGLASSNVSKLNQAWDEFMQNLTGGTSGLAAVNQAMANIGTGIANVSNNLSQGTGKFNQNAQQFAADLKTFTGNGAQAWQNFNQIVGSTMPQLIDWLRTAGAEGAVSGQQFTQAVLDMASALVPLASQSKVAQTEVLGLVHQVAPSITTWGQLQTALKNSGASLSGLDPLITGATNKMGNMSQVAQNLGTATQTALLSALSSAKVMASGVGTAMQQYEQALMNGSTHTGSLRDQVLNDFAKMGIGAQQAEQIINAAIAGITPSKTIDVQIDLLTSSPMTQGSQGKLAGTGVKAQGYAGGTPFASAGWAWVGEAGPELVKFRGGETVVPNSIATGYAGGAGMGGDIHVHISMDGRQIASAVATRAVQTQRRTGHNGMTKRTR